MKIKTITLQCADLEATRQFYEHQLGLTFLAVDAEKISFRAGASEIIFLPAPDTTPSYHFAFNIPKNKVEEALEWVQTRFEPILNPEHSPLTHFPNWNAHSIYFFDNNRNILEFIAREDLPAVSDQPFSAQSILSVSEIGLVVDKPLEWAKAFVQNHPIDFFAKGPVYETFTALGDDDGLLIISHPGRNWFPTSCAAEVHGLGVLMEFQGAIFELALP